MMTKIGLLVGNSREWAHYYKFKLSSDSCNIMWEMALSGQLKNAGRIDLTNDSIQSGIPDLLSKRKRSRARFGGK